jgi:hypothetical protein
MATYKGYTIESVKEQVYAVVKGDHGSKTETSYQARIGDKVIVVGMLSKEEVEKAIDRRIMLRNRIGVDPVG